MDFHIGELTSEVEVADQQGPLAADQIERIVALVIERLEQRERQQRVKTAARAIAPGFLPRLPWE